MKLSDINKAVEQAIKINNIRYSYFGSDKSSSYTLLIYTVNTRILELDISITDTGLVTFTVGLEYYTNPDKRSALLELFNRLMLDFKFVRFRLDDNGHVKADCNLLVFGEDKAAVGKQILMTALALAEVSDIAAPHISDIIESNTSNTGKPCYTGGVKYGLAESGVREYVTIDRGLISMLYGCTDEIDAKSEDAENDAQ